MDLEKYSIFLQHTGTVIDVLERLDQKDGEMFNLFEILGRATDEVMGHSAFIAYLLNPHGSHGQEDKYLKLFLQEISDDNYEHVAQDFLVRVEHSFDIEAELTGRIDIWLESSSEIIVIENKIYADDQPEQMERYHSYAEQVAAANQRVALYYLTLDGSDPTPNSLGSLPAGTVTNISYEVEIDHWIGKCIKESVDMPIIRESLVQYQSLIRSLTGKTRSRSVETKLMEMLKDPNMLKVAVDIEKVLPVLKAQIQRSFWESLEKELIERMGFTTDENLSEYDPYVDLFYVQGKGRTNYGIRFVVDQYDMRKIGFKIEIAQECHFGFIVFDNGNHMSGLLDNADHFSPLVQIVSEIDSRYKNNNYWLGWMYPNDNLRLNFREFDRKCAELADPSFLKSYVNNLADVVQDHITKFRNKLAAIRQ